LNFKIWSQDLPFYPSAQKHTHKHNFNHPLNFKIWPQDSISYLLGIGTTLVCERRAESGERRAVIWRAESVEEIKIATPPDKNSKISKIDKNIPGIFQILPNLAKKFDLFPWEL